MKSKIKLLVVTPYFPPSIGGVQNYSFNIAKGLMKDYNYEIVVITSNHESKEYKEETLEGMKIYRLPIQFKISNTPISFKWKKQITEIIKKENPDIINAHSPVPFISDITARIANRLKIPFVLTYHSGSMKKENAFLKNVIINFYESMFLKKTLRFSNKIICSSDFVREKFLKNFKDKSLTINPGVDLNLFSFNLEGTINSLLFVGRIGKDSRWKGINYLIGAIPLVKEKIPGIKLNLVGGGDDIERYKEQIRNLGLDASIKFIGTLEGKKLVNEYNKSNVLILPSISEAESFGMVLIEAMACKKPVIGSDIGGIPYVINNGKNGLLVPPKDSQALADAIIKILSNPKLAKQMGENGYKKVKENFTWDVSTKKMNETIGGILRK